MTGKHTSHGHPAHRTPAAGQHPHGKNPHAQRTQAPHPQTHHPKAEHPHAQHPHVMAVLGSGRRRWSQARRVVVRAMRHRAVRRLFWASTLSLALAVVGMLGLWARLNSGPIELDVATPWLKAAIEKNFGGNRSVEVGGTQIERDEDGRTSLRLRDIVVRDADGTVVASAPKAEVGISAMGLLRGTVRARSLNLVGAAMAVRIEPDGAIIVFAGADKRPIATAAPAPTAGRAAAGLKAAGAAEPAPVRAGFADLAGLLAWIDGLGATGLDGHDLRELGLKNGSLTVDDRRSAKQWNFTHINVILTRPQLGGVMFRLTSEDPQHPWELSAAMRPVGDGERAVGIEARKVSIRDLLLALRIDAGTLETDLPISASIRAEIAADGTPQAIDGRLLAEAGTLADRNDPLMRVKIDRAEVRFSWDVHKHLMVVPFQVHASGNQFTMRATVEAPSDRSGVWQVAVTRDDPVIDPVILAAGDGDDEPFALNRAAMRVRFDTMHKRIDLEQGDFGRIDTRPSHNVGVAVTGSFDYSGAEPHLAFGVAGTRMPVAVMKRLWPIFTAGEVRRWVDEHVSGGTVERVVVAGNAPLADFKEGGPPTPEEGLSVDMETSGTTLRPIANLPAIRDADLTVHVTGATANISLGRGTVEVSPGRKLSITGGVFEVADTHPKPSQAVAIFRVDGTVPAAAELLASDALRDNAGLALDPTASRGTVSAQVTLNMLLGKNVPKNSASYTIAADLTNFSADKLLMGQKVEASLLKIEASQDGYEVKGDAKINGTAVNLDFKKSTGAADGDLQLTANIDEAARNRLGIDFGGAVTGTIPVKVTSKIGSDAKDEKMNVDADLTPVKIDNLLPGWVKAAGKPAHAVYALTKTAKSSRFDDLSIDGSGVAVKGAVEIDNAGEIVSANFPTFSLSQGDRAALKADRGADGVLRVAMRGDIYDGTNFVKSSLASTAPDKGKHGKSSDLDLDIKLGTVIGYNGETLRGLDLKLSRRAGHIRSFLMNAKIGSDAPLNGDLRLRARDNHQVIYFETDDAGALFRFTDMYPHMFGGQMWVAMDPPSDEQTPQQGTLNIHNFVVRGEPGLDRVVAGAPGAPGEPHGSVDFSEASCDFTKVPGRMSVRDGVVRGPLVGATVEGNIDYVRNDVHLRGTFVPFYGLNNMFGQIPIVGIFLGGGSNEGLLGITYDAVGPPGNPRITINPVSAIAPGLLRKFFPSPGGLDRSFAPPSR
jgi:hypothetical protein